MNLFLCKGYVKKNDYFPLDKNAGLVPVTTIPLLFLLGKLHGKKQAKWLSPRPDVSSPFLLYIHTSITLCFFSFYCLFAFLPFIPLCLPTSSSFPTKQGLWDCHDHLRLYLHSWEIILLVQALFLPRLGSAQSPAWKHSSLFIY